MTFEKLSKAALILFIGLLAGVSAVASAAGPSLDKSRYIGIDEIKPGMKAYCLTCFKGTEVERFDLEVLSIVRNLRPGKNAIFVQGTDERFIHSGPVGGCSGSPVYIEGRLAGALAFGWLYCKDPLYGVTPIDEMLRVTDEPVGGKTVAAGSIFNYSGPIDFGRIDQRIANGLITRSDDYGYAATALLCPLVISGISGDVCSQLDNVFKPFGLMPVAGGNSAVAAAGDTSAKLVPGAPLAVPLVSGDISMTAIGTVTEVVGDKVYGFGHSFLGYGSIDLPMATGEIHTVVSSIVRSFKLGSALETVGALTADESTAIFGRIGKKAQTFPMTITVDRYNDPQQRTYNCTVAHNKLITAPLVRSAIAGAVAFRGSVPPHHSLQYDAAINIKGSEPIKFENISTGLNIIEMLADICSPIALLMNNPYKKTDISSVDINVCMSDKNIISHIWSASLSDSKIKAGDTIAVDVIIESVLTGKKKYQFSIKSPDNLPVGRYDLIICGSAAYRDFLRSKASHKFIPENYDTLVQVINRILSIRRDRLYCILVVPPSGITVEADELPDLPFTKQLVLSNASRTITAQPYSKWIEKSIGANSVVIDKKLMNIIVEK